jgi:hypothetical protein
LVRRAHKAAEFSSNFIIVVLGEDSPGNCMGPLRSIGRIKF